MCDYSLHNVKSRPAKVGDKLTTHHFNTGTRGFAAPEDVSTAVCVLPGTEVAFAKEVRRAPRGLFGCTVLWRGLGRRIAADGCQQFPPREKHPASAARPC